MNWSQLFLSANGRIGRRNFAIGVAALFAGGIVVGSIPLVGPVAGLALLYPWVCVAAKRLHDIGRSGRLALGVAALALLSSALGAAGAAVLGAAFASALAALTSLAGAGFVLWLALTDGDPGTNAYGAAPSRASIAA